MFLTGHTGFKGGWLSLWLQSLGAEVTGYALAAPAAPSLFELARVGAGMVCIEADIRDLPRLTHELARAKPEVVIHLAAQPLVLVGYEQPAPTFATNVMGTVNLLEAVRAAPGVRAVLNVTTDKCYASAGAASCYREGDSLGGDDPYSSSKACAELVTAAYRASFFNGASSGALPLALASARAGNVIGGGDWARHRLVPDALAAFSSGNALRIRHPEAIRPWQHVLEPLRGYLSLCERLFQEGGEFAQAWNFGPQANDAKSVGWVVEQLAAAWGPEAQWQFDAPAGPPEAQALRLDSTKAASLLGWHPRLPLEQALSWVIDWERARLRGTDMQARTLQQIALYQRMRDNPTGNPSQRGGAAAPGPGPGFLKDDVDYV